VDYGGTLRDRGRFCEFIIKAQIRSSFSDKEIAAFLNIDYAYYWRIKKGQRRPNRDLVIALGFVFQLELSEMELFLELGGYRSLVAVSNLG